MPGRSWRAGHGPRRIAQHLEQSGPLPLFGAHASVARNRKGKKEFYSSLGFHYISRLAAANIGCASEKGKNKFSFSLGFHYICKVWRFL